MSWQVVFSKYAQKDAQKLVSAGLKPKAQELLAILAVAPFQNPPSYENWSETWPEPIRGASISTIASSKRFSFKKEPFVCCVSGPTTNKLTDQRFNWDRLRQPR